MTWRRFTSPTLLACVLWMACGAYATGFVYRGWIAHDEGTIGQSAERVLAGDLPHRDFDEVYTGGLTYLHAAGMKVFGVNLRAPRLVLFGFFMGFLAAVYAIGRRLGSPHAALVVMALVTVWSVPNYFVGLPSWYNLFFATFGVLAFLRYLDTSHRRWLFLAGACGGLSVLAKIAGVFYLAGGVIFLAYLESTMAAVGGDQERRSGFWPVVSIPAAVLIVVCLRVAGSAAPELLQLFVPALMVSVFVAWREWAGGRGTLMFRARRFAFIVWPFAAGAALVIAAFVLWFWQQHAMPELLRGVFVLPQRRLTEASARPPAIAAIGLAVPYGMLLLAGLWRAVPRERLMAVVLAGALGAVLMLCNYPRVYQATWAVARATPILAVVSGLWILTARRRPASGGMTRPSDRASVFLLVTMAAVTALVQFPYATPIYFCYAAPMIAMAVVAIVHAQPLAPRGLHLVVASFFFLFAMAFMNRSYGWNLGVQFVPYRPAGHLDVARGGLWVPEEDKRTYEELVSVLQQRGLAGTIFAGPDCPEVYFLSGFPNPTRALFDFLTPVRQDEAWMAGLLARSPVRAAVINTAPLFSPPLEPGVLRLLQQRFPSARRVGRFEVRFE